MNDKINITKMLDEITKIRQLIEILARDKLKDEIERIATTESRKKMWNLIDGLKSTSDLAEEVGISQRAVQMFIKDLQEVDLIEVEKRGYPKRKFDRFISE